MRFTSLSTSPPQEPDTFVPCIGSLVAINQDVGGFDEHRAYARGDIGLVLSVNIAEEVASLLICGVTEDFYLGYIEPVEGAP
jgi:hypothetical protein